MKGGHAHFLRILSTSNWKLVLDAFGTYEPKLMCPYVYLEDIRISV